MAAKSDYVNVTVQAGEGTPFCRIIMENRPQHISCEEELQLLSTAFAETTRGRILVEFDSPSSLQPRCLARIQHMAQIRDAWVRAGAPRVTFLSPPPLLWVILRTLEIDYTKY